MDEGDVVVLFSDGITEASRPDVDEEFGEERLAAILDGKQRQTGERSHRIDSTAPASFHERGAARGRPDTGHCAPRRCVKRSQHENSCNGRRRIYRLRICPARHLEHRF